MDQNVKNITSPLIETYIELIFHRNDGGYDEHIKRLREETQIFNLENISQAAELDKHFPSLFKNIDTVELFSYLSLDPTGKFEVRPDHTIISYDLTETELQDCLDKNEKNAPYIFLVFNFLRQHHLERENLNSKISVRCEGAFVALINNSRDNKNSEFSTHIDLFDIRRFLIEGITKLLYADRITTVENCHFCSVQ